MFALFVIVGGIALYILPTIVAMKRHCDSIAGIAVINLFLGWTLLGWVGSLVWAVIGECSDEYAGSGEQVTSLGL